MKKGVWSKIADRQTSLEPRETHIASVALDPRPETTASKTETTSSFSDTDSLPMSWKDALEASREHKLDSLAPAIVGNGRTLDARETQRFV